MCRLPSQPGCSKATASDAEPSTIVKATSDAARNLYDVNRIGFTSNVRIGFEAATGRRRWRVVKAGVLAAAGRWVAAAGSPRQVPWRVGKLYQKCRPAPVETVSLCVTDNPNAAIIRATTGENVSGLSTFIAV